jgi:two-component system, LytTR family, sensor kinase
MTRIDWRRARREALLGLTFWGALTLFFYTRSWVSMATAERPTAYAWADIWWLALIEDTANLLVWTLLTPVVLELARRYPIRGEDRIYNLGVHLLACAVLTSASDLLSFWVATYTFPEEPTWTRFFFMGIYNKVLYYAFIVAAGHAIEVYRRYRDRQLHASRLETQLTRAHLHALEMQIQPHFLFNTLNSISELVHHDPPGAELMIAQLGDLLRMTTDSTGRQEVPLARELHFVGTYLEIERTRFQDRLSVKNQVDPDVLDCLVPNLILQPLVENAVRHGLSPRVAPGTITITARRVNDRVRITVRDDGRGLPPAGLRRERVGLGNTRTRLRQTYGDDHRFEMADAPGGGTLVMIEIPYRPAGAESFAAPRPDPQPLTLA